MPKKSTRRSQAPPVKQRVLSTYTPPDQIIDLVDQLVNAAQTGYHDRQSDETMAFCVMCGEWEGHTDDCPIPKLKEWMNS